MTLHINGRRVLVNDIDHDMKIAWVQTLSDNDKRGNFEYIVHLDDLI